MPKLGIEIDNNIKQTTNDFKQLNTTIKKTGTDVDTVGGKMKKMGGLLRTALAGSATLLAMKALKQVVDDVNKQMDEGATKTLNYAQQLKGLYALAGQGGIQRGIRLSKQLAEKGVAPAQTLAGLQSTISGASSLTAEEQDEIQVQAATQFEAGVGDFDIIRNLITRTIATNPETFKGKQGVIAASNFIQKTIKESGVLASGAKAAIKPIAVSESTGLGPSQTGAAFAVLTQNKVSAEESGTAIETLAFKYAEYTEKGGKLGWEDWLKAMSVLPILTQKKLLGEIGAKVIGILGKRSSQISSTAESLRGTIAAGNAGRSSAENTARLLEETNPTIALGKLNQEIKAKEQLELSGLGATSLEVYQRLEERAREKNRASFGATAAGIVTAPLSDFTSRGYLERGDELNQEVLDIRELQNAVIDNSNRTTSAVETLGAQTQVNPLRLPRG